MTLHLSLRAERGALQRVLMATARRGFEPVSLRARRDAARMDVELVLDGPRDVHLLARTLRRLFDVERAEVVA